MDSAFVGQVTNYASVASDGTSDPPAPGPTCQSPNCDDATTNVTPTPAPLIKLRKTAPGTVYAGSSVVYTIELTNEGDAELPAGTVLRVDDQLPAGSSYVSAANGDGVTNATCATTNVTGLVSCSVTLTTALAPDALAGFTLTATAPTTTGTVVNYASVAEDGTSDPPPPDSCNSKIVRSVGQFGSCSSASFAVILEPPTPKPDPLAAKMNRIDRLVRTGKAQGEALLNKKAALLMHSSSQGQADQHA